MPLRAFRFPFALPLTTGSSISISSTGPFRMEMPGALCAAGGFALSIISSTLSEMMPLDLGGCPEVDAVSEGHLVDGQVR